MIKVSVIVPVYNTQFDMLTKCINSILGQNLPDMEIIVVDDGSTNSETLNCLNMFSVIDTVKILYLPHRGVAHARNKGVESAKGEYIGFVDSDDYAEIDMYQKLYDKAISTGADIVICDYYEENVDGTCKIPGGGILALA